MLLRQVFSSETVNSSFGGGEFSMELSKAWVNSSLLKTHIVMTHKVDKASCIN